MPQVPVYSQFQAMPSAGPATAFELPNTAPGLIAGKQTEELSQGLQRAGTGLATIGADIERQANQVRVSDATNELIKADTDLRLDALKLRGKNALERPDGKALPDEFAEKLAEHQKRIAAGLGNDAQRQAFTLQANQVGQQLRRSLGSHMIEQQRQYEDDTDKGTISTAQDRGALLWGDAAERQRSTEAIAATVAQRAQRHGWDDATKQAELQAALSPMHVGVMRGMIQAGQASGARAYFEANMADMTAAARETMRPAVKEASDTQAAEGGADAVWAELGPKTSNEPVKLFDMEARLREQFKDNPDAMTKGLTALRQRAQAFNAQQAELRAAGINGVYALIDGGTPMRDVMRSDAWLSLGGKEQHEVRAALERDAATRASRAAAEESRAYTAEQRRDHQLLLSKPDAYLSYSDPQVLAGMTRAQVQALRPELGLDATKHLLDRWDTLQTAGGKLEAQIDSDTFNQVAQEMGLDPFKPKKSEDEKATLGALKYRVEALITQAQTAKKGVLTRSEKEELVRGEMARTVTVDPGVFSFNKQVPVIALGSKDAARVVIPQADRAQIVEALRTKYAASPLPQYEPTEANVRSLYLSTKSKAGGLINAK